MAEPKKRRDPRRDHLRRRTLFYSWLANLPIAFWIGRSYLEYVPEEPSLRLQVFAWLGLLVALATMALVPALLLGISGRWIKSVRGAGITQSLVWMFFHVYLYTDTRVYNLFRYHLGGSAWNLLTTKGSQDSYELGASVWVRGVLMSSLFITLQWLIWKVSRRAAEAAMDRPSPRSLFLRPSGLAVIFLIFAATIEKGIYAQAELTGDRLVAHVSQALPFYPKVRVEPLIPDVLRDRMDGMPSPVPVRLEDAKLSYPLHAPAIDPEGPRPNILVIVLEAWRADALDAEVTPGIYRRGRDMRRFANHISTGNQTRFGLFGMLYGLHGSYWWPVLQAKRSPVLVDVVQELGYDLNIFAAASMTYPELRSTAWINLPGNVHDGFPGRRAYIRDRQLTDACIDWWRSREEDADPFFSFVLLDSSHPSYDFPADETPFEPFAPTMDYVKMSDPDQDPELPQLIKNRYLNALHHADTQATRLLDTLEELGELDNTIVIVTGDHGQEFAEFGHWGHTSNFSPVQIRVPFLMSGPGVEKGIETLSTSHLDVASTLLELLGADPEDRRAYSLGNNLLDPEQERSRAVAGWKYMGLWDDESIIRIPMDDHSSFEIEAYGHDWQAIPDSNAAIEGLQPELRRLQDECSQFLLQAGS